MSKIAYSMKKIGKGLLMLAGIVLFASCNDWLEMLPPQDLVQDEYWKTKEDVNATLMAAYKKCAELDDFWFMGGEIRADMVQVINNNDFLNIGNGKLLPDNDLTKWNQYYEVISYCNYVLDFAGEVKDFDPTFTDYQLAVYEAEALFLRSYVYFFLVKMYGEVPFVELSAKTDNQDFYLPASSEDFVLSRITDDLLLARLNVAEEYGDLRNTKGRPTRAAVDALLADIYLWREDYNNCIKHCNFIDSIKHPLMPGESWYEMFFPGNALESIMEFQLGNENDVPNTLYNYTYGNSVRYTFSSKAFELFYVEGVQESLRSPGTITTNRNLIWKYAGVLPDQRSQRPSAVQASANWILYRMADVYLMKAEALVQLERYSEAMALVNIIRERVFLPQIVGIPDIKTDAEDIVLEERAKELAYEGKRWWDLMRMGRRNNFERKEDFIEIVTENLPVTERLVLINRLLDPNGWYWPIHDDELDRNKNLKQNPFYAPYSETRN